MVDLATGRVTRRITLAADPEYVDAEAKSGPVVVVSARAGAVTILDGKTLRPLRVLRCLARRISQRSRPIGNGCT